MPTTRRAFLAHTAGVALLSSAALAAPPRTALARLGDLEVGAPFPTFYPDGHPVVVIRLGHPARFGIGPERDVVGFSTLCTHQGCPLQFAHGRFLCPCHFSQFDPAVAGQCYQGPAHHPLPQLILEIESDQIFATGLRGLPWGRVEAP